MLELEKQMLQALRDKRNFKKSNTELEFSVFVPGSFFIYLHGNTIARGNITTKRVTLNNCGCLTSTTKSRLNALIKENIYQKAGVWFVNEKEFTNNIELNLNIQ